MSTDFRTIKNLAEKELLNPSLIGLGTICDDLDEYLTYNSNAPDYQDARDLLDKIDQVKKRLIDAKNQLENALLGTETDKLDVIENELAALLKLPDVRTVPSDLIDLLRRIPDDVWRRAISRLEPIVVTKLPVDIKSQGRASQNASSQNGSADPIQEMLYYAGELRHQGRWCEAIEVYDRVLAMDPGNRYAESGKAQALIDQYTLGPDMNQWPAEVKEPFLLAKSRERIGMYDEAEGLIKQAKDAAEKKEIKNIEPLLERLRTLDETKLAEQRFNTAKGLRDNQDKWDDAIFILKQLVRGMPVPEYQEELKDTINLKQDFESLRQALVPLDRKLSNADDLPSMQSASDELQILESKVGSLIIKFPNSKKLADLGKEIGARLTQVAERQKGFQVSQATQQYIQAEHFYNDAISASQLDTKLTNLTQANNLLRDMTKGSGSGKEHDLLIKVSNLLKSTQRAVDNIKEIEGRLGSNDERDTREAFGLLGDVQEALANTRKLRDLEDRLLSDIWRHFNIALDTNNSVLASEMISMLNSELFKKRVSKIEINTAQHRLRSLLQTLPGEDAVRKPNTRVILLTGFLFIAIICLLTVLAFAGGLIPLMELPFLAKPTNVPTDSIVFTPSPAPAIETSTQLPPPTQTLFATETTRPPLYGRGAVQVYTFIKPDSERKTENHNPNFIQLNMCVKIVDEQRDDTGGLWYFIQFSPNWGSSGWVRQSEVKEISSVPCTP